MVRVNFTCFPEKVRSGSKLQTIRPPRDDVHVGDSLQIWWTRRGLSAGRYCEPCALICQFEPATAAHFFKAHGGVQPHYVKLPQKLNEGVVTKFRIRMGATARRALGPFCIGSNVGTRGGPREAPNSSGRTDLRIRSRSSPFDLHYGIKGAGGL